MAVTIFISYSHKDKRYCKQLESHLSILRHRKLIDTWHDGRLAPGQEWKQEILTQLNTAQVILLLISSDFLESSFCYGVEMQRAIARHDVGEALVIPIILRPVVWEGAPFAKLQTLPTDAKPVTSWSDLDEAFADIVKGISQAIKKFRHDVNETITAAKLSAQKAQV